jgi:Mrp family chromosome partitioning ATPase
VKSKRKSTDLKNSTQAQITELALTLQVEGSSAALTFPAEVIESMRRTLSRLITQKTLPSRLSLVASLRQEGTTYLTRAMATTIAKDMGVTVCVVELNWWHPDQSLFLQSENETPGGPPGLAGVLTEAIKLEAAILHTNHPNLDILPAGRMPIADRPVLARSTHLKEIMYQLSEQYEYLILDIPAISSTNDAVPLASLGDACCLVIHQGVTPVEKVRSALDEIDHLAVLGVIMNKVHIATPSLFLNLIPQDAGHGLGAASLA